MPFNSNNKIQIVDASGDPCDDDNGRLKVFLEAADLNIGNVDVLSIVPGTGATNLGKAEDAQHASGDVGVMALAVRSDGASANLTGNNGDYTPLQVTTEGALYTYTEIDTSVGTTKAFSVASNTVSSSQRGIVPLIRMNDVVSAPSGHSDNEWTYFQTDLNGSLYTTHGMTGMVHGINSDVDATAEQLDGSTSGLDTACKRVDLMGHPDNTGDIYVGSTNAIAGDGSVGGIKLNAGDFYSIDIDNLTHIWVEANEADQELIFNYFT